MRKVFLLLWLSVMMTSTGCSRDDGIGADKTIAINVPDRFARYLNPINSLQAGRYTIVAATDTAGVSGTFTLTVNYDDGSQETFNGEWTSSGGQDETSADNPSFDITLYAAGGLDIVLESDVDTYLYLLDDNGGIVAENNDISTSNHNSQITLDYSRIDGEAFGKAYYDAIDPNGSRDTLEKWKVANGFYDARDNGRLIQPRFRDTKDLGYGRGMRVWTQPDGSFYAFVENFQVRTVPGLEYSTLNLDALINDQRQHHFGSNAIEFSTYPYGPGEPCANGSGAACATSNPNPPKFAKFFTFDATQGSQIMPDHANEVRLNTVNLDGRGNRAMPGACVYCHGGTVRPVRPDGSYRDNSYDGTSGNGLNGDTNAKLQLLEASSFEYWPESPYTRAEQELLIKQVNMLIYCTYPGAHPSACSGYCDDPNDTANCGGAGIPVADVIDNGTGMSQGEWTGDFARIMAEGWYDNPNIDDGDPMTPDFDSDTFRQDYVPPDWRHDPSDGNPPAGSDRLFTEVVQPVCFVCHSRRGTDLGSNTAVNGTKDIDFSSYDKFISHADLIEQYVFERGVMPLSLRGYNAFWNSDKPELLASFLDDFSHANSDGSIDQPGKPVADAGQDRRTTSPARLFGANSRFVNTYSWTIVSTPVGGGNATLTDASKASAVLTAPVDGDYVIRLIAGNGMAQSDEDSVTIKIDNSMITDPKDLTFDTDIREILQTTPPTGGNCISCHASSGSVPGIPMYWTDAQADLDMTLYEEFMARVDLNDPTKSLVLTKPSNNHHYGGQISGFEVDNPSNRQHYDTILNWILEGAREN